MKYFWTFCFFLLFRGFLSADTSPTVCLNMIVKNESSVILRCLNSVLPLIDHWVIVDTGSSDGTQAIIKDFMKEKGVPGELYERPWVDFGHNRNEALKLAHGKGDYILFIDADEYFEYEPGFKLPKLDQDFYYVLVSHAGSKYCRIHLINDRLDWEWVGVLHEAIVSNKARTYATLEKVLNIYTTEGSRSKDPQKYKKDAEVLEKALLKDPNNSRYVFYLAQSYRDGGCYSLALENFQRRATMGGFDEEVFWSLYQIGLMQEWLEYPSEKFIESYQVAFQFRKSRVEPLYQIAHYYTEHRDFSLGYQIAKLALTLPAVKDILFVQEWMCDYGILLDLSICAYWIGKYDECQKICLALLEKESLPQNVRTCVEKNLGFANAKLLEEICNQSKDLKGESPI